MSFVDAKEGDKGGKPKGVMFHVMAAFEGRENANNDDHDIPSSI